ncbi:HEXXH motif-containing putative peptide modification protein [Lysobacter yananisis]|uniref:HEXXH motif-containing putative peptide modification protein n=1 Tax=Lysobacter yananisis TaxID=1003114 RepID=A0ABY9P4V7_9GAMM|nr:HEXXH motif-containing putative peptide modification protein [Lysobacter yananisis]WMT02057.1 HEXXH motif-containing putative peptide modification protein [Lysobacter yananisis]
MRDLIKQVDAGLQAHDEFGNSQQIVRLNVERYRFALAVLAREDAALQALLPALEALDERRADKLFGDLLVRAELEAAIERLETGVAPIHQAGVLAWSLAQSLQRIDQPLSLSASAMQRSFVAGPDLDGRRIWIWDLPDASEPVADALREALRLGFMPGGHCEAELVRPTPQMVAQLDRACSLLQSLVPQVARSVFGHLHSVAFANMRNERGPMLTASGGDSTPCMIFIAPEELANPWDTAVHIMHEAVHLKLSDMVRTSAAVVREDMVTLPWGREISVSNCLFAFHAYVHLQIFRTAVEQIGPQLHAVYGAPESYRAATRPHAMSVVNNASATPFSRGHERMAYLAQQFRTQWSHYLTPYARRMVDWLCAAIAPLIDLSVAPQAGAAGEPAPVAASAPTTSVHYAKNPQLQLRPVGDRGILFAADPARPKIQKLNTAAWLMFELCDGRSESDLTQAYADLAGLASERAWQQVEPVLDSLVATGMIVAQGQRVALREGRAA